MILTPSWKSRSSFVGLTLPAAQMHHPHILCTCHQLQFAMVPQLRNYTAHTGLRWLLHMDIHDNVQILENYFRRSPHLFHDHCTQSSRDFLHNKIHIWCHWWHAECIDNGTIGKEWNYLIVDTLESGIRNQCMWPPVENCPIVIYICICPCIAYLTNQTNRLYCNAEVVRPVLLAPVLRILHNQN